ncbi:MAG: class I SAM-dependent methyltransferase [Alkalispirochaeta sp.]
MEQGQFFYRELASLYDQLFPVDPQAVSFIRDRVTPGRPVLDVACGTGSHLIALEGHGLEVYGIDYSPEMVEIAKMRRPDRVSRMDMRNIGDHAARPFSLIYSIGNSLSHLPLPGDVARFLAACRTSLMPEGGIILQTIDVSDLDHGAVLPLETLEGQDARMKRSYTIGRASLEGAKEIHFEALLHRPEGEPERIEQRLLGLSPSLVTAMLEDSGFSGIQTTAGFSDTPYSEGGGRVVVFTAKV